METVMDNQSIKDHTADVWHSLKSKVSRMIFII